MKKLYQRLCAITGLLLLAGCYINAKGHICGLTTPGYYCDPEIRKQLMYPGRMVEHWERNDRTIELRLDDWMSCGGTPSGDYWLPPLPNGVKRTLERELADSSAMVHSIQRCMMKKGYEYIVECYDSDISRSLPPCRARAGESWDSIMRPEPTEQPRPSSGHDANSRRMLQ